MIWQRIANWLSMGASCCLVTVREARGSTPREAGARMAIGADGTYTGTIGGGALEWEAMAMAQDLMARHPDGVGSARTFALGPSLGQCCGGSVALRFEVFSTCDLAWITPLAQAETAAPFTATGKPDARGVLLRKIEQPGAAPLGEREGFGSARRNILLFGAGHIGRALVLALAPLPFNVRWIDDRKDIFPASIPHNVSIEKEDKSISVAGNTRKSDLTLVMTHSHDLDFEIVARILKNPAIGFIGLIGSDTKRNRFHSRLLKLGIKPDHLLRLTCPIGLSGIRGKEPAVIAASIAAQLLMLPQDVSDPD